MARFLADDVLPACRRVGLEPRTATTNNGPEFGRAFVERFHGTVLHLHLSIAFRYRYYLRVETIDADLSGRNVGRKV